MKTLLEKNVKVLIEGFVRGAKDVQLALQRAAPRGDRDEYENFHIFLQSFSHTLSVSLTGTLDQETIFQVYKGDPKRMSQGVLRRARSAIGPLQIAIIILVVVTALIHLQRGLPMLMGNGGGGGPQGGSPPGGGNFPRGDGNFPRGGGGPPGGGGGAAALLSILPLPVLFILNFVGYIVLVTALYLPALRRFQPFTRWLLIAFAALTIVAWFMFSGGNFNTLALIDKVVEGLLIILLLIEAFLPKRAQTNIADTVPANVPANVPD